MSFPLWLALVLETRGYQGRAISELSRKINAAPMPQIDKDFLQQVLFCI